MKKNIKEKITKAVTSHKRVVDGLEKNSIDIIARIADAVAKSIKKGGAVYICGNGGSAADAQHIAAELVGRFEKNRRPLPAVALTTDTSLLTSVANDYSYDNIFVRQVSALVKKGDILWCISTSGSSPNILAAAKQAKIKNALVIAFTGKTNTPLEKIAELCFCAADDSAARSQEVHQLAYHIICGLVENYLCK
jgi:D-sedoheptulose 7-phosphate isomerase